MVKKNISKIIIYIILSFIAVVTLFPIVYAIVGSFKSNMEFMTAKSLFPKVFTTDNYNTAWNIVNFSKATLNSVIISVSAVVLSCIMAGMTGYVLDRKEFPGKKLILALFTMSMFVSLGSVTLYPVFDMYVKLKLNNTYFALILSCTGAQIVNSMLIKSYINGIPRELDEAAIIDGCGQFRVFASILLPLVTPMLATVGLLVFRSSWNSYLMPMILTVANRDLMPLSVAIVEMRSSGEAASSWTLMLAGTTISIVPMIIVFICANKYFVAGLSNGAVKG